MALSTLDGSKTQAQNGVSSLRTFGRYGRRSSAIENGLSVFAGLVLVLMLVPLAFIAWKSCSDFLSDKVSHSILYHPLEDWTR